MTWLHERARTVKQKCGKAWQCLQIMDRLYLIAYSIKFKNSSPFTGHKILGSFRFINFNSPYEPPFPIKCALVTK